MFQPNGFFASAKVFWEAITKQWVVGRRLPNSGEIADAAIQPITSQITHNPCISGPPKAVFLFSFNQNEQLLRWLFH